MSQTQEKNEASAHTPLVREIRQAIGSSSRSGITRAGGIVPCITFRDYMALCLYHPKYGYYRSGQSRVGRDGDFYTSAYISDIMGEQLAERLSVLAREHFGAAGLVDVVDWGGGTGRLGGQMLKAWEQMEGGERFVLTVVESSPEHRKAAAGTLAEAVAASRARVISPEEAEKESWKNRKVIVTANELLDAFPVRRVAMHGGRLREWGVCWDEPGDQLAACLTELADPEPAEWLEHQRADLLEGQTAEFGSEGAKWTARLAALLGRALLVLIDYGDSTLELTGAHRMNGTLLCYENHRAYDDPFRRPGEADLTAHVDFDLVRRHASEAGWRELWYGTQKWFLVESGVMAKLTAHGISDPFHPVVRRNRAIRQLLLSDGMSELFKVQIWAKE